MQRRLVVVALSAALAVALVGGWAVALGELTFVEAKFDGVDGVDGLAGATDVAVSPDGAHVYATGGADDAVAVFSRNPATGQLAFVEMLRDGAGGVDGLAGAAAAVVSPDGAHVYVAGAADGAVARFARDAGTGALAYLGSAVDGSDGVDGLAGAASLALSPDGAHLYVAGRADDAVAVFSRDPGSGALTFVEAEIDGFGGGEALAGAAAVAVSPNGAHVYVAAATDDSVTVFSRDALTGGLSFGAAVLDGSDGVDGLDGAAAVATTPDGALLFAAGPDDDAVAVFSVDGTSGLLSFLYELANGDGSVTGLAGARGVAVRPDGQLLYVAGGDDDAVAVFRIDDGGVEVSFVEAKVDEIGGVDGLDGAGAVAPSPDGGHVYVAGEIDHAVVVLTHAEFVLCNGMVATIVGSDEADGITGSSGDDVIAGLGGDDVIDGGGGNDTICAGAGDDTVLAGAGDDLVDGGPGDDVINGGPGVDTVTYAVAPAAVVVDLGSGVASGGAGADTLTGVRNLIGSAFDDKLAGNAFGNHIDGGGGADRLKGKRGDDILIGGDGNDTIQGRQGDDDINGGPGDDTASFFVATSGVTVDLGLGTATGDGTDSLTGVENVSGSREADIIVGNGRPNQLIGFKGNDTLDGAGGDDVLRGKPGDDTLFGRGGEDRLLGGAGTDTANGGPGADFCRAETTVAC